MNKDEILERSRKEKKDEGLEYAMNKGRRIGTAGMSAMFIIIVIFNLTKGINNYAVFAIFWTYIGLENLGKYTVTRERKLLFGSIACILAGLLYLVSYILYVMG